MAKIMYTRTDEAPLLATYSLKPIVEAFARTAGVEVETRDISLAGRIIAQFPELLTDSQRLDDALKELGDLARTPGANIIKLPNISASVPQLKAAVAELQSQGFDLPDYPEDPQTDEEKDVRRRFDAVKGSAVNPVLREGNSDRRAPKAIKQFAKKYPHSMGEWANDSKTSVATMSSDDFASNEKSVVSPAEDTFTVRFTPADGEARELKSFPVLAGEVVDGTFMNAAALDAFLKEQIAEAKKTGVLFSVHLKATMMKVSDPVLFGYVVRAFLPEVFATYGEQLAAAGLSADDGLGAILSGLDALDGDTATGVKAAIDKGIDEGPALAMVDSSKGITNLHVPSDVIVDASMPAMIRVGGKMWGADDATHDTLAVIPDSSYAGVFQAVIEDCRANGAFDPTTHGLPSRTSASWRRRRRSTARTTRRSSWTPTAPSRSSTAAGEVVMSHDVSAGDIWRACQTKDIPIRDWVRLAVERARLSGTPAVFWLDENRAHDANLIAKVKEYLADHNTDGLDIRIMSPIEATKLSVERIRRGEDTISVTGNVLRDYNTDLFPILELGTSAKMLSVVPLIAGGGLFETGAGGSAPKHVQQLVERRTTSGGIPWANSSRSRNRSATSRTRRATTVRACSPRRWMTRPRPSSRRTSRRRAR